MSLAEPASPTPPRSPLQAQWQALRAAKPGLRNRDAAAALGVSEAELLAAAIGAGVQRLRPDWRALFAGLPALGRVMALTRNESVVHERKGAYNAASFEGHVGLVLGDDIDLRIFLNRWAFGFAVSEESRRGTLNSLQMFDRGGTAVHKIYAQPDTDAVAWVNLVAALRAGEQDAPLDLSAPSAKAAPQPDSAIDADGLIQGWAALQDTHHFQPLLNRFKATPTQAFRLARGHFAWRLSASAVRGLLNAAAAQAVPIMVFVGNPGIIQIHSGPVARIQVIGEWLNVLDPDFNLHLREDHIAEVWRVEKPTADGVVTSVEVFDAAGERMATFFGTRKPGQPELTAWRHLAQSLEAL
jgi:putative hemin transport protein